MLFSIYEIQKICEKIFNSTKALGDLSERDLRVVYSAYAKLIGKLFEIGKEREKDHESKSNRQ